MSSYKLRCRLKHQLHEIHSDVDLKKLISRYPIVVLILYKAYSPFNDSKDNLEMEESSDFIKYIEGIYMEYESCITFAVQASNVRIYYDVCSFPSVIIFINQKFDGIIKKQEIYNITEVLNRIYYQHNSDTQKGFLKHIVLLWGRVYNFFYHIFRKKTKKL